MSRPNLRAPLRVLITTPNLDTAGSKFILADLIRGLDRSIVRPSLCVHRRTHTPLEQELAALVDDLLELSLRVPVRPYHTFWQRVSLIANQFRSRFDIIHSFDYASNWQEGLIARRAGIPWVAVKTNLSWNTRKWWLKSLFAHKIVLYSQQQYEQLYKGTVFAHKTCIINVGIDTASFVRQPREVAQTVRLELDLPLDSAVLGCVAHLVPVKGHVELIRAFSQVVSQYSNAYLVLVGGGEPAYEAELRHLTATLGLSEKVRFLGVRSDVVRLLQAFDGLVLATRNWGRKEAFGTVLVEAMACGLPVIATRSGGPEDIVVPQETGWLVDPEGTVPLVHAMLELLGDAKRRQQFGAAGRLRAERLFSRELMVRKYQEIYLQLYSACGN